MTIFGEVLLILIVSAAVGYPLFSKKQPTVVAGLENMGQNGLPHLLVQKEVAYATLKDLDFDFNTGKLSDEDYQQLKNRYEQEAMAILEKIDQISKKTLQPVKGAKRKKGRKKVN